MNDLVKNVEKQINIDKEVISVLPRNGIKAIKNLLQKIEEMQDKYTELNKNINKEIETRYNKVTDLTKNEKINELEFKIDKLNEEISVINKRTSYEKMGLDKNSYNINGYYKKSIETINKEIIQVIKNFEKVGIKITSEDFCISEYAKEYMKTLIQNEKNGEVNSSEVKECFERVYWKCSELMSHIYVNIRYIYEQNETEIDKFYKTINEEFGGNDEEQEIENKKFSLIRQKKDLENIDGKIILDNFVSQKYNIGEYKEENYKKIYEELTSREIANISEEEKSEMDDNIEKLYSNLVEYSEFLKYKFIYDELLNIRKEEKEKQEKNVNNKKVKSEYETLKENLKKEITNIIKMNEKINKTKKSFFSRKNTDEKQQNEILLQRNEKILEVKKMYLKIDDEKIRNAALEKIFETSTYLDVLKIASYYYDFVAKAIIKKEPEVTDKEIIERIEKFRTLIKDMNFSVLNNVMISENKPLSIVIKDRYKLFGITLTKESLEEDNLEELLKKTKLIYTYNNILKSNITLENLNFAVQVNQKQNK